MGACSSLVCLSGIGKIQLELLTTASHRRVSFPFGNCSEIELLIESNGWRTGNRVIVGLLPTSVWTRRRYWKAMLIRRVNWGPSSTTIINLQAGNWNLVGQKIVSGEEIWFLRGAARSLTILSQHIGLFLLWIQVWK